MKTYLRTLIVPVVAALASIALSPMVSANALAPTASVEVSASSVGGCEQSQSTISTGVQLGASCSGNLGLAEANLAGESPVATASAVSSNPDSGTFGGSEIIYDFSFVPNGEPGGPSVPSTGIPFTIAGSASVTFSTEGNPLNPAEAAGASLYVGGDVEVPNYVLQSTFNPTRGCVNETTACNAFYQTSLLPNSAGDVILLASCDIVGVASCSAEADPTITIGAAYAPYYQLETLSPVPLPASAPLLGLGIAGFATFARRKRRLC